jgi:uncharacterized membrane protein YfcA
MLVALAGLGVVRAVAHTKLLNLASNLAALAAMIVGGHVLWLLGFAMAAASIAGGKVGAHAAMRFGGRAIRPLLVLMCLALTVKLLADPHSRRFGAIQRDRCQRDQGRCRWRHRHP